MKKKLPALLCALALILSLAGCVISTPDTVGTIGDVEITSGLEEGETVLLPIQSTGGMPSDGSAAVAAAG